MKENVSTVKEIKKLIDEVILPGYTYKTNFSLSDYLVEINERIIVKAELVKQDNLMVYEFRLDTQFVNNQMLTYDELKMCMKIIEFLENNRKFVLSRLKKYTVEGYDKEQAERRRQSEAMFEALKKELTRKYGIDENVLE